MSTSSHVLQSEQDDPLGMVSAAPRRAGRLPRVLRWAVRLCLLAVFTAVGGFVVFAAHVSALTTPTNPKPADAIIVVTGGLNRLEAGFDLLEAGKGKRLLISGAHPTANKRALREASDGDAELFNCCVDIDYAALDTIGNAAESGKWMTEHDFHSVILVTNNYHMPRSLLEMQRIMQGADIRPFPVVTRRLTDGSWLTDPDALRVIATEYVKYVAALTRRFTGIGSDLRNLASTSVQR